MRPYHKQYLLDLTLTDIEPYLSTTLYKIKDIHCSLDASVIL